MTDEKIEPQAETSSEIQKITEIYKRRIKERGHAFLFDPVWMPGKTEFERVMNYCVMLNQQWKARRGD